jgi:hypothetical protein
MYSSLFAFSINKIKDNINIENENTTYMIKLTNGDIISANIIAVVSSIEEVNRIINQNNNIKEKVEDFIPFIIIKAFDEEIFIYEDEIIDISVRTNENNTFQYQNHSYFLLPTANPISNNHFIGSYELFFIMGGLGILDYVSVLGAYSFIPLTNTKEQITLINAKVSIPLIRLDNISNIVVAAGYNYGQINARNKLHHLFGIATYNYSNDNASIGIFYKVGEQDFYSPVVFFERGFDFIYPNGSFGICGGFEAHFSSRKDLSLLFEIWNNDIGGGTANTGILLGLRLSGKKFYSDFGLTVITAPFVAPFFSFVWMPFGK